MKKAVTDNSLRRIKEEIRAEAVAARLRAEQSTQMASAPALLGRIAPPRNRLTIKELSRFQYVDFIEQAYASLLRRTPDSTGFAAQVRLLETGRSKIEVLGNLRFSGEGREIGVHVPWLLPRYLLAKSTRIPLLGYVIEWLMCIGGLPRILRHQRAADAYHAARNHELKRELPEVMNQFDLLREEMARFERERAGVDTQLQQFGERFPLVHSEIGGAFNEIRDLRHLVLSMNHWLASLRQNLSALEAAEVEHSRGKDAMYADIFEQVTRADPTRARRLDQWSAAFAATLPATPDVLDIGSGTDWLQRLSGLGVSVTGINANNEIGQRARDAGITVAVAEPSEVLARIADQSLDGVSILDFPALLRSMSAPALLEALFRVLRPGGKVIVGSGAESATITDRLEGRAAAPLDEGLIERASRACGFVEIQGIAAAGEMHCVIVSRPV